MRLELRRLVDWHHCDRWCSLLVILLLQLLLLVLQLFYFLIRVPVVVWIVLQCSLKLSIVSAVLLQGIFIVLMGSMGWRLVRLVVKWLRDYGGLVPWLKLKWGVHEAWWNLIGLESDLLIASHTCFFIVVWRLRPLSKAEVNVLQLSLWFMEVGALIWLCYLRLFSS